MSLKNEKHYQEQQEYVNDSITLESSSDSDENESDQGRSQDECAVEDQIFLLTPQYVNGKYHNSSTGCSAGQN